VTRVHVWGAAGYAASEAIRLVTAHPELSLGVLESRSHAGENVAATFPMLRRVERHFDPAGSVLAAVRNGDIVIAAGAEGESLELAPQLLQHGARVVDLSADHRFEPAAAYGLTEWNAYAIARAALVANPGCYPTASLLALLPLATLGEALEIVIDAKSGITGAGRNPKTGSLFAEVTGEIRAYGLDGHRHLPEIEGRLRLAGIAAPVTFTPHVVPLARGMLADVYAIYNTPLDARDVHAAYAQAYAGAPFVRMLNGTAPSVAAVAGTNDAEICVSVHGRIVRAICAIDNLGKGAAGQAIANINLMCGFPEELGFDDRAIVA
jgi:N-acetyl-gamma-glutamyl-phosphate reductase